MQPGESEVPRAHVRMPLESERLASGHPDSAPRAVDDSETEPSQPRPDRGRVWHRFQPGNHGVARLAPCRNRAYSAGAPELAAWVHNVLTDSFLAAYQSFGPCPLTVAEADQFVAEQTRIGALLDASPLPSTANELARWIVDHPALASTRHQADAVAFLRNPPLPLSVRVGYRLLFHAAAVFATCAVLMGVDGRIARGVLVANMSLGLSMYGERVARIP